MNCLRYSRAGFGIAFVAAYLLVLQSVIGAFASSLNVGTAKLDAASASLCVTSGKAPDEVPDGPFRQLPECCTQACSMFVPVLPMSGMSTASAISNNLKSDALRPAAFGFSIAVSHYKPANPRAPPLA